MQNLSSSALVVGPATVVGPVANNAANSASPARVSVSAADAHAALFASHAVVADSNSDGSHGLDSGYRGDSSAVETQPSVANSSQACDSFFEQLQSDEGSDNSQQRTDGANSDSQDDSATDDYYEGLSADSGSQLLQV